MSAGAVSRREWRAAAAAALVIVALASLPYLIAFQTATPGYVFNGLLFNAYDGNSYLAKMEIGRQGGWLFRLPYTAEPGEGAPIFLFYIFLGHAARLFGASNILVFHAARIFAGLGLLLVLFAFVSRFFDRPGPRWTAWLLIALGSGLGWLAAAAGGQTSDLWVAEAIVFLSLFANPHFPLALALMLALYMLLIPGLGSSGANVPHLPPRQHSVEWIPILSVWLLAVALALIQPFSLAILFATIPAANVVLWVTQPGSGWNDPARRRILSLYWPRLLAFAVGALPWLGLDLWLTRIHPALRAWSAQNVTLSPPVWDYLITFSPALLLALPGAWVAARRRNSRDLFLVTWLVVNAALLYAPVDLQRRLIHGLSVPIGLLAVEGLYGLIAPRPGLRRFALVALLFTFALPSSLLVAAASLQGAATRHHLLYLTEAEAAALDWIDDNTPHDALVLASPDMGLFIPAHTLRRVLYGHPFETVNAEAEEQAVLDYYAHGGNLPAERGVDYVMYGPREAALGPPPTSSGLNPVFEQNDLVIYQVAP